MRTVQKEALSITLILGLLLSSLALSSSLSESLNTITQALTDNTKWTDEIDGIPNYDFNWYYNTLQDDEDATEFTISTAADLAGLAYLVNKGTDKFKFKVIKLTADIDLGGHCWVPIGDSMDSFEGTFDGQGHTIKNRLIGTEDKHTDYRNAGLFGSVKGATIENVNIDESCKIYIYDSSWDLYIGGICAYVNETTISNCANSGKISPTGSCGVRGVDDEKSPIIQGFL